MMYKASGTILVCRFVKMSGNGTVAQQTVSGALSVGSSQDGGRFAPIPTNTANPVEAAQSGETLNIHMGEPGEFPLIEVGSGGVTYGGEIMSDGSGKGIAATTGKYVQGIAQSTAAAGEYVPYRPVCYQLN